MTTLFENILCLRVSQDGRVGIRAQQRFLIGQWRSTKDQSAIEKKRERPETSETTKTKLLLRLRLSPALGLFANRTMNHSGSDSFLKKKKSKQTNKRSSSGGDSLSVSPAPDSMHRSSQTESSPLQNLEIQYPLRCLEIKGPTPKNKKVSYELMRWTTRRQPSSKLRAPFFWNLLHNLRFNTPTQPRNSGANT